MTAEQDYPLGNGDEVARWRAMCDEINQLRATQHVDREAEIGRLAIANNDLRESARLAQLALSATPKVIRRVFRDPQMPGQVLVEVWVAEGVVKVAGRLTEYSSWSPPFTEVLNEDGES